MGMNLKHCVISFIAVFAVIFAFDWIFHGNILHGMYMETSNMWRPETQMRDYYWWMLAGQALFAVFFCMIYCHGAKNTGIGEGLRYGALIAALLSSKWLIVYAVVPYPLMLIVYWIIGAFIEFMLAGAVLAWLHKKCCKSAGACC